MPFVTPLAKRDIHSIRLHRAQDSVYHADLVEQAIFTTFDLIAKVPRIGHARPDLTQRKILFVAVGGCRNYVVAYAEGSDPLRILRVLHGARDVPRLFEP